ncbi:MAG: phosphotransferase [Ardenticatenaceae bacterium]|nr:phosphotransferase [Ardenticatenaceae bacterium]MCB8946814.1 phosphotransferase [Ardenticatenaceae bacterium]
MTSGLFRGVMKLKTLCVAGAFSQQQNTQSLPSFPANVLVHTHIFKFYVENAFDKALDVVNLNRDIDLIFIDADKDSLSEIIMFMTQAREIRPKLPIVVFTSDADDRMRYLMRAGATWHFLKESPTVSSLVEQVQKHVFSSTKWQELFAQYASDTLKPRIEPGLSYTDLEALTQNPEERYIIKRLFAGSDVVQIFRMDEGFSGSRIYTVKPAHQLKRILKIDVADRLEAVQEKQERLIQPRLNRPVGQIQGKMIRGEHLAGACYTLAGSNKDAITLTQFLRDQNRVRKELIDKVLSQLRLSLEQLYAGSSDTELRYWAPLYARVLPPSLTLDDAVLIDPEEGGADYVISADELTTLSAVPVNPALRGIHQAMRNGEHPTVVLRGFEVAELDTKEGVLYVHDDLISRYPISNLLKDKNHPILRFKIRLRASQREMLTHPVFRRGKRISVRGRVSATDETILADSIKSITGTDFDFENDSFEFASGRFLSPITNVRCLLWEIGREDMIVPIPQVSPVVHGDLNTSNILVEVSDEMPVWFIDFSDARPGHVYFDLAKLEVEFRTHILYRLYKEMVDEGLWDENTATQFALLVENVLLQTAEFTFEDFLSNLRDFQPEWYDNLYTHFPMYSENLLYFLFSLRQIAETYSPERFKYHFPVAVFFHSVAALKFKGLDDAPWAKRLALCSALVSGKQAIEGGERPSDLTEVLSNLRQRSSFAAITVGSGEDRKYLLQWNSNWGMFNLVGGKVDNQKGDRDSFARAIQRELQEELGIRNPKDYRIVHEFKPVNKRQFSRREFVFKDYEFRIFQIELLPRHPITREEFDWYAQRFSTDRENVLVSRAEIERLRTIDNRPISDTTRMILQELGEITATVGSDLLVSLDFELENEDVVVSRGRANVLARLINPLFGNLVENATLEILPSNGYETERDSAIISVGTLDAGQEFPLSIWLQPREKQTNLTIRATYYDVRGHEYRQLIEKPVNFQAQERSLFHIDNPYVVGKPLTPASEDLYQGREDVFMWIEENLLGKTQPHTLILYGQRRMGKTSTLYQLVGGKRGKTIREYPGYPIYPVYIDLQRLAGCEMPEFFARLSQHIIRNLHKRGIIITPRENWSTNGTLFSEFDQFLDEIEDKLPPKGLLVLIIDELEQLQESVERGRLSSDIFPYLRSLMQHRSRVTFILAGTNQLVEDYWSIIFHVGISREIDFLSREETEKLIREPVAPMIQYDDLAVDRIWLTTRGQPYFSQLICHRLVSSTNMEGRRSKLITIGDVRDTINLVIEEDDSHLQHLWNESTAVERFVMASLAGTHDIGEENVSRAEISARLRETSYSEDAINMALKQLEVRRLLTRVPVERQIQRRLAQPNGWEPTLISKDYAYAISFDLLRRWVARKHPLGSLLSTT